MSVTTDLAAVQSAVTTLRNGVTSAQAGHPDIATDLDVTDALSNAGLTAGNLQEVLDGEVATRAKHQCTTNTL
jgi:hypothetical protein